MPSTAANVLASPRRATLKTAVLECVWTGNPGVTIEASGARIEMDHEVII